MTEGVNREKRGKYQALELRYENKNLNINQLSPIVSLGTCQKYIL